MNATHTRLLLTFSCAAILAGCSSPSKRSGGGYYKDDGPGSDIPANIMYVPDAVPRIEPLARANTRPYQVFGRHYTPMTESRPFRQEGVASWYGRKFHGNSTANGETYDMYAMTAAHPTLPLPSYARVTHKDTRRSAIVRINDRGPFHSGRVIDLSYAAAAKLGMIGPGSGPVIVEAITHDQIRAGSYQTQVAAAPDNHKVEVIETPPTVVPATPESLPSLGGAATAPPPMAVAMPRTNAGPPLPALAPYRPPPPKQASGSSSAEPAPTHTVALAAPAPAPIPAPAPVQVSTPPPIHAAPPAPAPAPAPAAAPTPLPALAATPAPAPAAPPPPAVAAASGAGAQIFLQFGAFGTPSNAQNLADKLNQEVGAREARNAQVQPNGKLHRVLIGPYASRTDAVNAAHRIQQHTGMASIVAVR